MSGAGKETSDPLELKINRLQAEGSAWPSALNKLRMACVGCYLDGFHTLRQALRIYGIAESEFLRTVVQEQRSRDSYHEDGEVQ